MRAVAKAVTTALVWVLLAVVIGSFLGGWIFEIPFYVVFGWIGFMRHNAAALQVNSQLVVEALACLTLLGVGAHYFCRWLHASLVPDAATAWRARWTVMGLALLFLLFAAGIGTIGLTHQAAWLVGASEPFLRVETYSPRARVSEAMLAARPLRDHVAEVFALTGRLPDSFHGDPATPSPGGIAESVSLGQGGVITIVVKQQFYGGGTITLSAAALNGRIEWKCRTSLPARIVPVECRA